VIDWAWVGDHLDELVGRTLQHLGFTVAALAVGFALSFALSLWAVRRRRVYAPITAIAGVLYTMCL
jgi:osmoprotectant transport system permease protein